ncbi:hypothetical protein GCM10027418_11740 [Mariniluteicoccus endophyticus]
MTANLTLAILVGVLVGTGVTLLMSRGIVRAFLGVLLMSNGINLLFLIASGPAGRAPIVGTAPVEEMSDPLPQAMVLTAIVITLALTGFVMALSHRSWQLDQSDVIVDDTEDVRILARAEANDMSGSDFTEDAAAEPDDDPDPGGHSRQYVPPPHEDEPHEGDVPVIDHEQPRRDS